MLAIHPDAAPSVVTWYDFRSRKESMQTPRGLQDTVTSKKSNGGNLGHSIETSRITTLDKYTGATALERVQRLT